MQWMIQIRREVDYIPWKAGHQCTWRGGLIPTIAGMLQGPQGAAIQDPWKRHLNGRMVEGRVVFPQKARQRAVKP
ncbi:hypothetical protein BDW69DRAFT_190790 [Aspergillus filifer]